MRGISGYKSLNFEKYLDFRAQLWKESAMAKLSPIY